MQGVGVDDVSSFFLRGNALNVWQAGEDILFHSTGAGCDGCRDSAAEGGSLLSVSLNTASTSSSDTVVPDLELQFTVRFSTAPAPEVMGAEIRRPREWSDVVVPDLEREEKL